MVCACVYLIYVKLIITGAQVSGSYLDGYKHYLDLQNRISNEVPLKMNKSYHVELK